MIMKKRLTKIVSLICALSLVLVMMPTAMAYNNIDSWAEPEISDMERLELLPVSLVDADMRRNILRKEMCATALLAYEKYTGTAVPIPENHPFTDTVDENVEKAYAVGIVHGDGNGLFRPEDSLTREEFFQIIKNFLVAVDFEITDEMYVDLSQFPDIDTLSSWALDATSLTVGLGIVKGSDGNLEPAKPTIMEQGLVLFYRVYIKLTENQAVEETPPVENTREDYLLSTYPGVSWGMSILDQMDALGMIPQALKGENVTTPISRIMVAKFAVQVYGVIDGGLTPPKGIDYFTDTKDPDVNLACDLHLMAGDGNGKFRPNDPITREEFFKVTVNLLNAIRYNYSDDPTVNLEKKFTDAAKVSEWAKASTRLLVSMEIVKGSDGMLLPKNNINMEQVAAIFQRCYNFNITWSVSPAEENRTQISRTLAERLVAIARSFEGYPYVYGGSSPSGFDCSGFVQYCYKQIGITTGRVCSQQMNNSTPVERKDLLPGDLLFFADNCTVAGISHVGIYIGNGKMIHASGSKVGVIISDINSPYYIAHFIGAGRFIK